MKTRVGVLEAINTLTGYLRDTCEEDYEAVENGEEDIGDSILPAIEVLDQYARDYKMSIDTRGYELEYEEGESEPKTITHYL